MRAILVNTFRSDLDRIKTMTGSLNAQTLRSAFRTLLQGWARSEDLFLLKDHPFTSQHGTELYPEGVIVDSLRLPRGYWDVQDSQESVDEDIAKKTKMGYPTTNILYETSEHVVLIQNGSEVLRTAISDIDGLIPLLKSFFSYESPEVLNIHRAASQFQKDLPEVLKRLRKTLVQASKDNKEFAKASKAFLAHAKGTITPTIGEADVREMLIQHILTKDIFGHVFNDSGTLHESRVSNADNITRKLYDLEHLIFQGTVEDAVKKTTQKALAPYCAALRVAAAHITTHREKQTFLKVIYEGFCKTYDPKAVNGMEGVHTPSEIARFMIEGTDWLFRSNFGRGLMERNVEILDPCAGTGTFICELLESFRGEPERLAYKYKHELHANELSILPYSVAALNIEDTYAHVLGQPAEYPSLCFMDTLNNIEALGQPPQVQADFLKDVFDENNERIKRQNGKKVSVIIGCPPQKALQQTEMKNNRAYPHIDGSIKDTYINASSTQGTRQYDMHKRFLRWATDRLEDIGVVAFVMNRAFIDTLKDDGFRRTVGQEFTEILILDLGGDVRANPKLSPKTHNVFGNKAGVAIAFFVKTKPQKGKEKAPARIRYARRPEMDRAEDKLAFLSTNPLEHLEMQTIIPSKRGNWINQIENEWDDLIPIANEIDINDDKTSQVQGIFSVSSLGLASDRDEWATDKSKKNLQKKMKLFQEVYSRHLGQDKLDFEKFDTSIKWTPRLVSQARKGSKSQKSNELKSYETARYFYKPFTQRHLAYGSLMIDRHYAQKTFFPKLPFVKNPTIGIYSVSSEKPLSTLVTDKPQDLGFLRQGNGGTHSFARYRYTDEKVDNITNWALRKFRDRYSTTVTKTGIFHYCYAVLHDPVYRETYAINLKREFPRIPFYPDFETWREWGQSLMDLHIGYEAVKPLALSRVDMDIDRADGSAPKPILKSFPEDGQIKLDADTTLTGIPTTAWDYRLGNRSAIDWVLDQHKEKKPRDPTIREKFNTYRFADYKDHVIDLLGRVARVSVDTVAITDAMAELSRKD